MTGQPGDGCTDPRSTHPHWCDRCGERQWRSEVDELTAPDYRKAPR